MQIWQTLFLQAMESDQIDRKLQPYIDELLAWLGSFSDIENNAFTQTLFSQYSTKKVHLRLYTVLDNLLFIEGDGFYGVGDDAAQVKKRYRRLMRIYHPDRSIMNASWMNKRAEQINTAYAHRKKNNFRSTPHNLAAFTASPIQTKQGRSPLTAQEKAFSKLTVPKTQLTGAMLQRRVLLGLIVLTLLLLLLLYWDNTRLNSPLGNVLSNIPNDKPLSLTNQQGRQDTLKQKTAGFISHNATTLLKPPSGSPITASESIPFTAQGDFKEGLKDAVEIMGTDNVHSLQTLTSTQRQEIEYFVDDWTHAWAGQDLSRYLSFYAKEFASVTGLSSEQWLIDRRLALSNKQFIRVKIYDMEIKPYKKGVEVRFLQYYFSDVLVDKVQKILLLEKQGGHWKIIKELAKPVG